jgi:hypothetical protein
MFRAPRISKKRFRAFLAAFSHFTANSFDTSNNALNLIVQHFEILRQKIIRHSYLLNLFLSIICTKAVYGTKLKILKKF